MKYFIKKILLAFLTFILLTFSSCDTFDYNKHLAERYYLKSDKFGKTICYKVDEDNDYVELLNIESATIGFDDNYIIIKRAGKEYYIIVVYKGMTYFPEKSVLGPFNAVEFNKQKRTLNIKTTFTLSVK
jgi:hypothetical protein